MPTDPALSDDESAVIHTLQRDGIANADQILDGGFVRRSATLADVQAALDALIARGRVHARTGQWGDDEPFPLSYDLIAEGKD